MTENKNSKKIPFDPGYESCTLGVSEDAAFIYNAFQASSMGFKEKKFQFSILYPRLKTMLDKNIAFYLGCLLWAVCIKDENAEIENNPCFGAKYNENDSLEEINYLIKLLEGDLNRDSKYFIGKNYEPKPNYLPILKAYKEFLSLNKGFVELKNANEIILPSSIKNTDKKEEIKQKIFQAIETKDLTLLYEMYEFIL